MGNPDGMVVLAILVDTDDDAPPNEDFQRILNISTRPELKFAFSSIRLDTFDFQGLVPADTSQYFKYRGSSTTPPCQPKVTWVVFNETIRISREQAAKLSSFAMRKSNRSRWNHPIQDNFRPVSFRKGFAKIRSDCVKAQVLLKKTLRKSFLKL